MDIQTVSIALAGIGIFIAAINFIVTSRKADQQRQVEVETRQA
jgi:heme/copper-type cytochrome/quinol oxidase subunit 1